MKRLPWAAALPLVTISNARLISHRASRLHWSTHLVVTVRTRWASAGVLFRCAPDWPVVCADVTALPADRSEKPVLKSWTGERETGGGRTRGAASSTGTTGYSHYWTDFTLSFSFSFRDLTLNTGDSRQCYQGEVIRFSSKTSGTVRKKNWLRVKVWLSFFFLWGTEIWHKNQTVSTRVVFYISTNGFVDTVIFI